MWRSVDQLRRLPLADYRAVRDEHLRGTSPFLGSAKLKLVDACNLRCFMCDYWHGRRAGELDTDEVKRVLADLASLGCRKVHFTGGEIFMRRDAIALFEEATRLGMRVNLTTNGTLLDKGRARAMLELPVRSVTLSLDSPSRKIHDEVRGRSGAFKKTLRTLDYVLAHRKPKTRVRMNMVVSARSYRSLVELPELLAGRPIDGLLLIPMDGKPAPEPGEAPSRTARVGARLPVVRPTPHEMTKSDVRRYNETIAPFLAERLSVPGFDAFPFGRGKRDVAASARGAYARGHYDRHRCHVPWLHTLVSATGEVYPCCMGHRNLPALGNVRETSLVSIWNGEAYRRFRESMLRSRPEVCGRCDDFLAENRAVDALDAERLTAPGS